MLGVPAVRCAVEPRHDRLVAAIGHVVDEAPVAAVEIERLQDPKVAPVLDTTPRIARGPIEVDDAGIQGMSGIEFTEYGAVQALIGSDGVEIRAAEHGTFLFGYLDPLHAANAHAVPRTEPIIGESLTSLPACRKSTSALLSACLKERCRRGTRVQLRHF